MNSHLNIRMSAEDKKTIETAAKLKGLKLNTYVCKKILEAAEKDIAEMNQLNTLSSNEGDWQQFLDMMEVPDQLNKDLKKSVKRFRKEFGD